MEELVKPDKKAKFSTIQHQWFPCHGTPEHPTYDKGKLGLFKVEWKGDNFVGLAAKASATNSMTPKRGVPEGVADVAKSIRREQRL